MVNWFLIVFSVLLCSFLLDIVGHMIADHEVKGDVGLGMFFASIFDVLLVLVVACFKAAMWLGRNYLVVARAVVSRLSKLVD